MYDSNLVYFELMNNYQIRANVNEKNSYYTLKNDIKDFVEDFYKSKEQRQFESIIINNVKNILSEVHL
jgi:hypothetical protein